MIYTANMKSGVISDWRTPEEKIEEPIEVIEK